MPQVDLERSDLELIKETLTYYEDRVRNYSYEAVPAEEHEAERLRRQSALNKSATIRYRITAALRAEGTFGVDARCFRRLPSESWARSKSATLRSHESG
jgi:hypothetical protein